MLRHQFDEVSIIGFKSECRPYTNFVEELISCTSYRRTRFEEHKSLALDLSDCHRALSCQPMMLAHYQQEFVIDQRLGTTGFGDKVAGLSNMNLVQPRWRTGLSVVASSCAQRAPCRSRETNSSEAKYQGAAPFPREWF